jgi:hypothetical protein
MVGSSAGAAMEAAGHHQVDEAAGNALAAGGRGPKEPAGPPCPRCESTDTKFCYYNNYNWGQPRHFCKGCRRYWTRGGALRNVPVGGGTRKPTPSARRKRAQAASTTSPSSTASATVLLATSSSPPAPLSAYDYDLPSFMLSLASPMMADLDRRLLSPDHRLLLDHHDRLLILNHPDRRLLDLGGSFTSLLASAPEARFSDGFLPLPPATPWPLASSAPALLPPYHPPVSQALPEGFI